MKTIMLNANMVNSCSFLIIHVPFAYFENKRVIGITNARYYSGSLRYIRARM